MEKDKVTIALHKPGSRENLFFFFSGAIVSIPITLFFNVFSNHLCFLLPVFLAQVCALAVFAPFIEEFAKAYPLFYRHGETERSIFILGFLVGLGFGIGEFFLYVFGGTPVAVRLPGIAFHAASTSLTAYGIAMKRPLPYFLVAAGLHLSFNSSLLYGLSWVIGGPVILAVTFSLSLHLYRKTSETIVN